MLNKTTNNEANNINNNNNNVTKIGETSENSEQADSSLRFLQPSDVSFFQRFGAKTEQILESLFQRFVFYDFYIWLY